MRLVLRSLAVTILLVGAHLPAAEPPIQVEIQHVRPGDGHFDLRFWRVRFINDSQRTVFILRPLNGSTDDLLAPFYRFKIRGDDGETVKLGRACANSGLWGEDSPSGTTSWPADYLIPLPPNHAHEVFVLVPIALGQRTLPTSGTVDFEYSMPVRPPTTKDRTNPQIDLVYPDTVWRGTLTAKQLRFAANPK